jgi:hypothetical protein
MTPPTPSPSLPEVPHPCPASSPPTETIGRPAQQTTPSSQPTPGIPTSPPKDPVVGSDEPDSGGQDDDTQPPAARIHQLRTALSTSTNSRHQLAPTVTLSCGRRSRGPTWSAIHVQAFCQCGWTTNWQPWTSAPTAAAAAIHMIDAALKDHGRQSGHQPFPDGIPEVDGYHQRCGWFHGFQDVCPIPPDSPAGQLARVGAVPTLGDRVRSLHRLAAIQQLSAWLNDQQLEAIIAARLSGCTWPNIAQAADVTTQDAREQWGPLIGRYETAGLLSPSASTGASEPSRTSLTDTRRHQRPEETK